MKKLSKSAVRKKIKRAKRSHNRPAPGKSYGPRLKPKPTADDIESGDLPSAGRSFGSRSTTVGGVETYRRPTLGGRAPTDKPKFAAGDGLRDTWEPYRSVKR